MPRRIRGDEVFDGEAIGQRASMGPMHVACGAARSITSASEMKHALAHLLFGAPMLRWLYQIAHGRQPTHAVPATWRVGIRGTAIMTMP
ncbi:hypothetical protein C7830_10335 [Pandoraea apista]|nr:hypothetical protein C7830_10335 [Pandoraea apista]